LQNDDSTVTWVDSILEELAKSSGIGYSPNGKPAAEPTALATLAFVAHERNDAAVASAYQLVAMQQPSGEVSIRAGEESPGWPTSLAIVAWAALMRQQARALQGNIDHAMNWLLANRGEGFERTDTFGHNTELVGWSYALKTHSWVEPTAFGVLALKAANRERESAAREGISVLIDRQLPGGGLNYGNTYVLGQLIRSHVQPTGIALLALAGETDPSGRLEKSIAWLRRSIDSQTTPQSLAWAVLGLSAHKSSLAQSDEWLAAAAARVQTRDRSPHKLALLALAAKGWPL
jgi:hypothetical protein